MRLKCFANKICLHTFKSYTDFPVLIYLNENFGLIVLVSNAIKRERKKKQKARRNEAGRMGRRDRSGD